jgi:hypothetical protein
MPRTEAKTRGNIQMLRFSNSKCFHTLRPGHLLLFSLCPYRFGDLDSLPDFVIVVALPGKCGTFFSFGVAIMSHVEKCGLGFALIYQLAVSRVAPCLQGLFLHTSQARVHVS